VTIFDMHLHFSGIASFYDGARAAGVDYSGAGLKKECDENGIAKIIAMGAEETKDYAFTDNEAALPMGCDLPGAPGFMRVCLGINPHRINSESLLVLESELKKNAAGIKIYPGYFYFTPDDPVYDPIYALAEKYNKPVVIHTGGTYSEKGILDYSRPTHADRAAVKYRNVNFVLAHLSVPWVMESCQYAYKNKNVYVDLSGLIVGGKDEIERVASERLLMDLYMQGLVYMNKYDRVLYGSDWPLVPMKPYIEFCKKVIPEKHHAKVFYKNAAGLFGE